MKNIVIFNKGYLPATTYGGPVVSISNLVKELSGYFNFYIVCSAYELDGITPLSNINLDRWNKGENGENILYLSREKYKLRHMAKLLEELDSIDLVYVNSFFDAKQLFKAYRLSLKVKSPIIIAPRGELEENALLIKSFKKKPYIFLMKNILNKEVYYQSTNENESMNLINLLNVKQENILALPNLPSIPKEISMKKVTKLENVVDLCFISRIQTKKNLMFALECLEDINSELQVNFDIFGPIENKNYWKKCLEQIDKLPNNVKVQYCGVVARDRIFKTFNEYDLFFFPTLSENYGHVIAEALFSSCPVLISDQTPWTDINKTNGGRAFPLGKKNEFVEYIEIIARMNLEEIEKIKKEAKKFAVKKTEISSKKEKYIDGFGKMMQ